jgi:hypothetical protein
LLLQRNRWQRVTEETLWKYKYMIFNPRYGGMGFLVMPYYLLYEVFGAFFEFISLFLLGLGFALGSIDIRLFGALFLFMMLAQGIVSLSSILAALRGQKLFNSRYTAYLILLGFLELLWYHWIISFAKISGTYSYSRRDRKHDQYEREKRN